MVKPIVKRYSLAFKKEIVKEYEAGASIYELQRKYGIGGSETISRWVKKYSREGIKHKLMVIQKPEEQAQVKALKERVAELEKLAAQLALDLHMTESCLEVAEDELGYEVKKKDAARWSKKPQKSEPRRRSK